MTTIATRKRDKAIKRYMAALHDLHYKTSDKKKPYIIKSSSQFGKEHGLNVNFISLLIESGHVKCYVPGTKIGAVKTSGQLKWLGAAPDEQMAVNLLDKSLQKTRASKEAAPVRAFKKKIKEDIVESAMHGSDQKPGNGLLAHVKQATIPGIYQSPIESPIHRALAQIEREVLRAKEFYPANYNSVHEGYAVVLEELDELWDEIKRKNPVVADMRTEAIQCAAMLVRFITELTPDK